MNYLKYLYIFVSGVFFSWLWNNQAIEVQCVRSATAVGFAIAAALLDIAEAIRGRR